MEKNIEYYTSKGFSYEESKNRIEINNKISKSRLKKTFDKHKIYEMTDFETYLQSRNCITEYLKDSVFIEHLKNIFYNKKYDFNSTHKKILHACEEASKYYKKRQITKSKLFYELLYGEDSEEYAKKVEKCKNFASCSFEKFSEQFDDTFTAEQEFKKKYGSLRIDHIMNKYDCDSEEAKRILAERKNKIKQSNENKSEEEKILINKKKALNLYNFQRKYGEILGEIKYQEYLDKKKNVGSLEYYQTKYGDYEGKKKYEDIKNKKAYWHIVYWINKGYTEKESKEILEKIFEERPSFSKKYCIEKYGHDIGIKIWKERQRKWQNSLYDKPQEEIDAINKSKASTLENFVKKFGEKIGTEKYIKVLNKKIDNNLYYSKEANKFFISLYKRIRKLGIVDSKNEVFFSVRGSKEYFINSRNHKKIFFYDFCIPKLKVIIEYHGVCFHPKKDDCNWKPIYKFNSSKEEMIEKDILKEKVAREKGFDYYVVWSDSELNKELLKLENILLEKVEEYEHC